MFENWIMIVFVLGYLAIAMEHRIGINKTAAALLTAVACWFLLSSQQLNIAGGSVHGIGESLSHHLEGTAQIIFFLIGAMTIVQLMETHGGFQIVTDTEKINFLWYLRKVSLPALAGYFAGVGAYLLIYRAIG